MYILGRQRKLNYLLGRLRAFNRDPATYLPLQAGYKVVSGHIGGISCVRFAADDTHIVSIGRGDRAVFVWTVEKGPETATLAGAAAAAS